MNKPLTELSLEELMKKFGAGSHKPGSGSAAALQGWLAAMLVNTVSQLTKHRAAYKQFSADCNSALTDIDSRIVPRLRFLLQEDSIIFDRVIQLLNKRKEERDYDERRRLVQEEHEALVPATEIPMEIAELCVELARYAAFNFRNGYRATRGDSGLALSGAVAVIEGCPNIIDLNILSYSIADAWSSTIRTKADALREIVCELNSTKTELSQGLTAEFDQKILFNKKLETLFVLKTKNHLINDEEIERLAQELQNLMWTHREEIWREKTWTPDDPREHLAVLKPSKALKVLGYDVLDNEPLGTYKFDGKPFEIAGIIDNPKKVVRISSSFASETKAFTTAHELGHALLHDYPVMHRDRPMDGSTVGVQKDKTEFQADKFAACFLMPRKKLVEIFVLFFQRERFAVNESAALGFGLRGARALRVECPDRRALSRKLASAGSFGGVPFQPLHKLFSVSVETMAIRLEEVGLV